MGNSNSMRPLHDALKELLRMIAPWFLVTGNLAPHRWEKLGRDLMFAEEQGILQRGVIPIWKLIRNCLGDEGSCTTEIKKGEKLLQQLKEEQAPPKGVEDEEQDMSADELESLVESMEQVKVNIQPAGPGPPLQPTAPGPPPPFAVPGTSFHPECWREVAAQNPALCFPVFQNQQDDNRYHEPLDFKIIKKICGKNGGGSRKSIW